MQKMISERYRRIRHARRPPPLVLRNGSKLDEQTFEVIHQVQRIRYVRAGLQGQSLNRGPSERVVVGEGVRRDYAWLRRELQAQAKERPEVAEMVNEILEDASVKVAEAAPPHLRHLPYWDPKRWFP